MDKYNPHSPTVIGNEWVPIRSESYLLDEFTERGYSYPQSDLVVVPDRARFYVDTPPSAYVNGQVPLISVYHTGDEDHTGPTRSLVIPVQTTTTTGAAVTLLGGALSPTDALENPSDGRSVRFNAGTTALGMNFFAAAFQSQLEDKRIVRLTFQYTLAGPPPVSGTAFAAVDMGTSTHQLRYADPLEEPPTVAQITRVAEVDLGEIMHWWSTAIDPRTTPRRYPWTYVGLQRLASAATQPIQVILRTTLSAEAGNYTLTSAGLKVTYCEENRVLFGGKFIGDLPSLNNVFTRYDDSNEVILLAPDSGTGMSTTGRYTVTLRLAGTGSSPSTSQQNLVGRPMIEAARQLYSVEEIAGVQIATKVPLGAGFISSESDILPEITLHTASAIVTGSHAYAERYDTQLWEDPNAASFYIAEQGIIADPTTAPRTYPQVRFYARRFAGDSEPLEIVCSNGSIISHTADAHDALPEILDGYKEVTLRFDSPAPTGGAGAPLSVFFSSLGTPANGQWHVIAAHSITEVTGVGTSTIPATYGGGEARLSLDLAGELLDGTYDAAVMLSEDPPAVTGLGVSVQTQELDTVDPDCPLVTQRCVPTGIYYHRVVWTPFGAADDFERVETAQWGVATTGQTWTTVGTAANFSVSGTGNHSLPAVNSSRWSILPVSVIDFDIRVDLGVDKLAAGGSHFPAVAARWVDVDNTYLLRVELATSQAINLTIRKRVAGVETQLASDTSTGVSHSVTQRVNVRFRGIGSTLLGKIWNVGDDEPDEWNITLTSETSFTGAGNVGMRSILSSLSTTPLPVLVSWDNFSVAPANFGHYELQRYDVDDPEWRTIALLDDPGESTFTDYEARVGLLTSYRIRSLNVMDFAGAWSVAVTSTLTSPGVVTSAGDAVGVLIFTSNEGPTGNVAYTESFSGSSVEQFNFPEAEEVKLQQLYGRDYTVAFRPLERGGTRFERVLLVNALGVPTATLDRSFRSLRDLAWADLSYVCVRDELGNRWFAAITVPDATVRRTSEGHLSLARVNVVQTTDTPFIVGS